MTRVMILNGPNLNLLGVREPHIYGTTTLKQIKESCEQAAARLGMTLSFHQSNHEGELVDLIQEARSSADAIIINPAAYSFTSIAIIDAIKAYEGVVVEVHISNIHARDELHRHSKISSAFSPLTVQCTAIFSFLLIPKLFTIYLAFKKTGVWPVSCSSTLEARVNLSLTRPHRY